MNDGPRYTTLMDYLAVLRRQRVLILVVIAAFAAGSYFVASRQTKTYLAESALNLPEPAEDTDPVGLSIGFRVPADQRAAISSRLVARPNIARQVKRALHDPRTPDQLLAPVSVRVEAKTNFLIVGATGRSPAGAARLSNEFARQFDLQQRKASRRRLAGISHALRVRLADLKRSGQQTRYTTIGLTDRIAKTEALAQVVRPVEIIHRASVPSAPQSPKVTRDAMLGALLGVILGVLAAFGRDSLDRRVRTAGDVERQTHLATLSRISGRALGKAGLAKNGRRPMPMRDLEAFRILRANLQTLGADRSPRIVAVTSAMPDEGKTTVAASLAWVNAAAGRRTLLIECDLRGPALAERLSVRQAPGLVEFLSGKAEARDVIQEVDPHRLGIGSMNGDGHASGSPLSCITAGDVRSRSTEMLESEAFRDFVSVVSRSYDAVILDTGPLLPVVDSLQVVPVADAVLLCVRASRTTSEQLAAAQATLERLPAPPIGVVVTGVRRDELKAYGYGAGDYATRSLT